MKTISVSRLKATLSEQLAHVSRGEIVVVTSRGVPVARLVPVAPEGGVDEADLSRLEREGLVRRGGGPLPRSFWRLPRPEDPDASLRKAILEEREGSW